MCVERVTVLWGCERVKERSPLHVLLAATWLGATIFTSHLLIPVVRAAGPAGDQIVIGLNRNGAVPFFSSFEIMRQAARMSDGPEIASLVQTPAGLQ